MWLALESKESSRPKNQGPRTCMAYWTTGYKSEREEVVEWTSVIQTWQTLKPSQGTRNLLWVQEMMISIWGRHPAGGWWCESGALEGRPGAERIKAESEGMGGGRKKIKRQSERQLASNCAKYLVCVCYFYPHNPLKKYEEMSWETLLRFPQRNKRWKEDLIQIYTGDCYSYAIR